MQNQKSALGMDANITALIGYLIGIVALILIFIEKDNKFVRFHALQSVLWSAAYTVGFIVILVVGIILGIILTQFSGTLASIFWGLTMLICAALFLGFFGGLIYGAIKAYGGAMFKLPVVGNMAEKWS